MPLVTVLGGRYIRPQPDEVRAINIWSYEALKDGEMPDDIQKALVVGDLKMLARVGDEDKTAEDIISAVVSQVYENIVSQNGPGRPLFEPTLSHFVAQLRTYPFDSEMVREREHRRWESERTGFQTPEEGFSSVLGQAMADVFMLSVPPEPGGWIPPTSSTSRPRSTARRS